MDEKTVLEGAEVVLSGERARFWHRIGRVSTSMILLSVAIISLRFLQVAVQDGKSEPGLFARCLGMAALASFIIGTFLAALWVLHALVRGRKPEQAGAAARRINPVASLLLTGRLSAVATDSMERDILSAKILLVLFAAFLSVSLLVVLWTYK